MRLVSEKCLCPVSGFVQVSPVVADQASVDAQSGLILPTAQLTNDFALAFAAAMPSAVPVSG